MVLFVVDVEVADGLHRTDRLTDVLLGKPALSEGGVAPAAGQAVGLQLEGLGGVRAADAEDVELGLQVVRVLVRDDVGDPEAPGLLAHAAGQALGNAAVQIGREALSDVDRVVGGAVQGGSVVGDDLAARPLTLTFGHEGVGHLRRRAACGPQRLSPVRVDVLDDTGEELLDILLARPALDLRSGDRCLGNDLLEVAEHLLDPRDDALPPRTDLVAQRTRAALELSAHLLRAVPRALVEPLTAAARERQDGQQEQEQAAERHRANLPGLGRHSLQRDRAPAHPARTSAGSFATSRGRSERERLSASRSA